MCAEWEAELRDMTSGLASGANLGLPLPGGGRQGVFTIYAWNEFGEGVIASYVWRAVHETRRHPGGVRLKPTYPRTARQQCWRDRFGDASRKYSLLLTDEQDACIAKGAKLRSRPRLGQSGPLTGQQYLVRRGHRDAEDA
jgi:hypothetical protein